MPTMTIPSEFTAEQFTNGCAEASSLRLPPGVAPVRFTVTGPDGKRHGFEFADRDADAEDATTAWNYNWDGTGEATPGWTRLAILND
jgi:hypothetical protein